MAQKQRMLTAYRGGRPDRLPWLANMDHWYNVNRQRGTLPERYRDWPLWDIQRDLRSSIWQRVGVVKSRPDPRVKVTREDTEDGWVNRIETPIGTLREAYTRAPDFTQAAFRTEWRVKTPDDLRVALYKLEATHYEVDNTGYWQAIEGVGGDGIVLSSACRDPLMALLSGWMGVERFSYALADSPREIDQALHRLAEDGVARARVAALSACEIFQVGGNITATVVSPSLFATYALPFFQEVCDILHAAGKLAQYHFDGYVRPLLPHIADSGLDAIEALTPKPSGDVTLAEAVDFFGDRLLIQGGVPAAMVTHGFDDAAFEGFVSETISAALRGRVALGMGDNVPPDGDVERVRRITEMVEAMGWYPDESPDG